MWQPIKWKLEFYCSRIGAILFALYVPYSQEQMDRLWAETKKFVADCDSDRLVWIMDDLARLAEEDADTFELICKKLELDKVFQ